jgi:predicted dehydrogenase
MSEPRIVPPPSVIVGYGRAGRGLHHTALQSLFGPSHPVLAVDPRPPAGPPEDAHWLPSLDDAIAHLESSGTGVAEAVFHIATCPTLRRGYVEHLVQRGARRIIAEKPIAGTTDDARRIAELAGAATILPVSLWLSSRVTRLAEEIVNTGAIGDVRSLHIEQCKPRFRRTIESAVHGSAFEVELPHQLLLALELGGPFEELLSAVAWPMRLPSRSLHAMGGAVIKLRHGTGVTSTLVSDLTAPYRLRRLRVIGSKGEIVADYPVSSDDHHGQVRVSGRSHRTIVNDDPLCSFLGLAYAYFAGVIPTPPRGDLALHVKSAELLQRASASATHLPALDMELAW